MTRIVDKVGTDKVMHVETCAFISSVVSVYVHNVLIGAIAVGLAV